VKNYLQLPLHLIYASSSTFGQQSKLKVSFGKKVNRLIAVTKVIAFLDSLQSTFYFC